MGSYAEGFVKIRDLINERSGIFLADTKQTFLHVRLAPRLKLTNSETLKDYYYYLKYDPNGEVEINNLMDAVTVSETFFFRHQEQLDDFSNTVIPELSRRRRHAEPNVIWSAGCATGEEAYTLAILLLESPLKEPVRVDQDHCFRHKLLFAAGRTRRGLRRLQPEARTA